MTTPVAERLIARLGLATSNDVAWLRRRRAGQLALGLIEWGLLVGTGGLARLMATPVADTYTAALERA